MEVSIVVDVNLEDDAWLVIVELFLATYLTLIIIAIIYIYYNIYI